MKKLLFWLSGYLPARLINDGDRPYLERYYGFTLFGVRCYLHRFVGSDPDRGLHDHPWAWGASLVLSGWYLEESRGKTRTIRRFNCFGGDFMHRVVIPPGGPREVWTLFFHRVGDVKPWGFMRTVGGVPEEEAFIWARYMYSTGVKVPDWWKTAPRGRFCKGRMQP